MGLPKRILATFPGKLGDLIYTLPAVIQLKRHFDCEVSFQTSSYCRSGQTLLQAQPCLEECFIDEGYELEHTRYGCQPWLMAEPSEFTQVFHLGFRPKLLGRSVLTTHLIETFFVIIERGYGLSLKRNMTEPYLFADETSQEDYVVFNGFGETLMDLMDPGSISRLTGLWLNLFARLDREVIIVSGKQEMDFHKRFGLKVVCPGCLLETAGLISRAKCFIGVQSVCAALADGLKTPRLVFNWFQNAYPTGPNALAFTLQDRPETIIDSLKTRFGV